MKTLYIFICTFTVSLLMFLGSMRYAAVHDMKTPPREVHQTRRDRRKKK